MTSRATEAMQGFSLGIVTLDEARDVLLAELGIPANDVAVEDGVVGGVQVTLPPDEAEALVQFLGIDGEEARQFRISNPFLYDLQDDIEEALDA